jgi:hypothetical protein
VLFEERHTQHIPSRNPPNFPCRCSSALLPQRCLLIDTTARSGWALLDDIMSGRWRAREPGRSYRPACRAPCISNVRTRSYSKLLSYASGTSDTPLLGMTIGEMLDRTAANFPDRLALISRHQKIRFLSPCFNYDRSKRQTHSIHYLTFEGGHGQSYEIKSMNSREV